jgi:hypothetical protein
MRLALSRGRESRRQIARRADKIDIFPSGLASFAPVRDCINGATDASPILRRRDFSRKESPSRKANSRRKPG